MFDFKKNHSLQKDHIKVKGGAYSTYDYKKLQASVKQTQDQFLVQNDPYLFRYKAIFLIFLSISLSFGFFYIYKNPNSLVLARDKLDDLLYMMDFSESIKKISKKVEIPQDEASLTSFLSTEACETLPFGEYQSLEDKDFSPYLNFLISLCFYSQDGSALSQPFLKKIEQKVILISPDNDEAEFQQNGFGEAFLFAVFSAAFLDQETRVQGLLKDRCDKWLTTYSCVGKFLVSAMGKNPSEKTIKTYDSLDLNIDQIKETIRPYIYIAGVFLAYAQKDSNLLSQRMMKAMDSLPKNALPSFRTFLTSQWMNFLWMLEDWKSLNDLLKKAKKFSLDQRLQRKALFLSRMQQPGIARRTLRNLLSYQKNDLFLLWFDQDHIMTILARWAMEWNFTEPYASYLAKSLSTLTQNDLSKKRLRDMHLMQARILLFQKAPQEALSVIENLKSQDDLDFQAVYDHLRGIALYQTSKTEESRKNVYDIFSSAYEAKKNIYSLSGKFLLALELKNLTLSLKVQKEWNATMAEMNISEQKAWEPWNHIFQAKINLLEKKPKEAISLIEVLAKKYPRWTKVTETQYQLYSALKQKEKLGDIAKKQSELESEPLAQALSLNFSPLGPLVLIP